MQFELSCPGTAAADAPLLQARGVRSVDRVLIAYGRAFEHPCKIRIVKWLIRGVAAGRIDVGHAGGAVVAIDPDDYIGWQIFKTGHYEPASIALARRIVANEPGLFVDVGANFGWFTLAIAPIGSATVISIEPESGNCSALRANIARNGLRNVVVCNTAVAASPALLAISRRSPGNSGTVTVSAGEPGRDCEQYWVAATPMQALLDRLVRPAVRPVLMKLDIEGYEAQALAGLDFDGPFRPKNILIECEAAFLADGWGSSHNLAAFLSARGYTLHDVFGRAFVPDSPLPEANVWARDTDQAGFRP